MSDDHRIHQIEFRWQPGRDFSATASSLENKEMLRGWSSRLSKLARPATPDAHAGVPDASFVYQTFTDGKAAIIWRLYERGAMALFEQSARQPLVARALIGSGNVLTPDIALALCFKDFVHCLLPPPGQVSVDAALEAIGGSRLVDEWSQPATDELDALLSHAECIEPVIATALMNVGKPLSVVLPASDMTLPPELSTALLTLWGLWRAAGPLLVPGRSLRSPGWSFSSYEPPLGSSEASDLPVVVFRSQEEGERGDLQPLSFRAEVTVRPRSASADAGLGGLAARKLLQAVRQVGTARLRGYLDQISGEYPDPFNRLVAIGMLDLRTGTLGPGQEPAEPLRAELAPTSEQPGRDGSMLEREPAEKDSPAEFVPEQERAPLSLLDALECLHAGPENPGFDEAKAFIRRAEVPADPAERDQVRRQMRARHWYLEPLVLDDRWHATETLEAILRIAVIPDLADAKVRTLLGNWAYDAPVELIQALSAAAHHEGTRAIMRLEMALQCEIYQRWLREHGVRLYGPPDAARHRQAAR